MNMSPPPQLSTAILNKGKSALAEHVCAAPNTRLCRKTQLITTNNRYGQRLCLEAWHTSNHAFNRDDSAYFPEKYMHLIGIIPWVFKHFHETHNNR